MQNGRMKSVFPGIVLSFILGITGCGRNPGGGSGSGNGSRAADASGNGVDSFRGELELFVPCAFAPPTVQIVAAFKQIHPDLNVVQRVENVEVLVSRIADGQTPDVFMSVGDVEMQRLTEAGRAETVKDFCFIGLALVVPERNPAGVTGLADLAKAEVKTVAIGAEDTSPGKYARQLLQESGLWDAVKDKVVSPKFPAQLLRFAGMEKADASIAYAACLRAGHGEWKEQAAYQTLAQGVRPVTWLDQGEYCLNIPCPAATIQGCRNPEAGKAFIDFLRTEAAQEFLRKSGFTGLAEPKCLR